MNGRCQSIGVPFLAPRRGIAAPTRRLPVFRPDITARLRDQTSLLGNRGTW